MGHSVDKITDLAKDTAGLFTGGTSGVNVAEGKAPTVKTLATDAAGLGAGAGLAGAGLGAAGTTGAAGGGTGLVPGDAFMPGALAPGNVSAAGGAVPGDAFLPGALAPQAGVPSAVSLPLGADFFRSTGISPSGGAAPASGGGGAAPAGSAVPSTPAAPVSGGGAAAPAAGSGSAPTAVTGADHGGIVGNILKGMRENAGLIGLGLSGAGLAMAGSQRQIPNEQQLNDLAASGSQAAKDLIASYRTGQLSATQQASLDQLTQQTKNQINQYFASIGQSDSTAHMQALAQVDQQSLGMKQQMLDNMLQQGLSAIGVASGPLNTVANFQIQRDKNLTDAFGNFASAVGNAFGRTAGTTTSPSPQITGQTPSSGAAVTSGTPGSTP